MILLAIYVIVAYAAQAYGGTQQLIDNADDVLSVLGTAGVRLAARQDPHHRRADVGRGVDADDDPADGAHQPVDGAGRRDARGARQVHPRFLTPHVSTILMGVLSIVWYVGLTIVSENILFDSIAALGLMIAFYYGLTGFACTIYYRHRVFESVKSFFLIGVGPTLGGLILAAIFVKSCYDLSKPENSESGDSWFGLGPPLVIGLGFLLLGVVLMLLWRIEHKDFFKRKREVIGMPPQGPTVTE